MAGNDELKKIKHLYGEEFMHLCRTNFPTILEREGMLLEILNKNFANNSRALASDLQKASKVEEFKNYVFGKYDELTKGDEVETEVIESPYELLKKAGYELTEARNRDELMKYKMYYAKGEELCSFADSDRTKKCVCFWAIKKDADMVMRQQFDNPEREDEYGTSVLAIQFDKVGRCEVSIKSRYNHTVFNPDATYGNDLNKIAPGLAAAFKREMADRGYVFEGIGEEGFTIPGYVKNGEEKLYKYNMQVGETYFCPGNVVITFPNNEATIVGNPEQQVLMDNYVLDLKTKQITQLHDRNLKYSDGFVEGLKDIEKIDRVKNKETGETTFTIHMKDKAPATIITNEFNQIVEYKNENLLTTSQCFMMYNNALRKLELPNVERVGDSFLMSNNSLKKVSLPNAKVIGDCFMNCNRDLEKVDVPKLERIGGQFLERNTGLKSLEMPSLKKCGFNFLQSNRDIENLEAPSLEDAGSSFLRENRKLRAINLPNLRIAGSYFLSQNTDLKKVELPNLEAAGRGFLKNDEKIGFLSAPKLKEVPEDFIKESRHFKKYEPHAKLLNGIEFAKLDIATKITEVEVSTVGRAVDWFRRTTRNLLNRNQDRDREDDER